MAIICPVPPPGTVLPDTPPPVSDGVGAVWTWYLAYARRHGFTVPHTPARGYAYRNGPNRTRVMDVAELCDALEKWERASYAAQLAADFHAFFTAHTKITQANRLITALLSVWDEED